MNDSDKLNRATRVAYLILETMGFAALWPEVSPLLVRDQAKLLRLYDEVNKIMESPPGTVIVQRPLETV